MLRKLIPLLVIFVVPMSVHGQDDTWLTDPDAAMELAERTDRLVLLHFWNEQCAPCRKLETFVFPDGRVQETLRQHYIPVKINTTEHPEWARRYRIDRIPQDLVVRADGRLISQRISPSNSRGYVAMLEGVAEEARKDTAGAELAVARAIAFNDPRELHPTRAADVVSGPSPGGELPGSRALVRRIGGTTTQASSSSTGFSPKPQETAPQEASSTPSDVEPQATPPEAETRTLRVIGNPFAMTALAQSQAWHAVSQAPAVQPSSQSRSVSEKTDQPIATEVADVAATTATAEQPADPVKEEQSDASETVPVTVTSDSVALVERSEVPANPSTTEQPAASSTAVPEAPVVDAPRVALEGFCPVSLVTSRAWKKGDERFGCVHRGKVYLFADASARDRFLQEPDKYAPLLGGFDPVAFLERRELVEGRREFGVFVDDQIVLFASEEALLRFESDSQPYLTAVSNATETSSVMR